MAGASRPGRRKRDPEPSEQFTMMEKVRRSMHPNKRSERFVIRREDEETFRLTMARREMSPEFEISGPLPRQSDFGAGMIVYKIHRTTEA